MLRSAKLSAAAVTALLAACASTGSEAGGCRSAGAAPSRPNVVLVFVDGDCRRHRLVVVD